jgi:hypothetical protein
MLAKLISLIPSSLLDIIYWKLFSEMVKRERLIIVRAEVAKSLDRQKFKSMETKING